MLNVNEIFRSIQGEGKTAGKEVIFIRLSGCNLHCIWCDTPYCWNWNSTSFSHPVKFDVQNELHQMSIDSILDTLLSLDAQCKQVVITGGEPLLQMKELELLCTRLVDSGYGIEIETNGTISPTSQLMLLVEQFNCSPKLKHSQNDMRVANRPEVLKHFAQRPNVFFKFVIANEDDIPEVLDLVKTNGIMQHQVYLMPEGQTKEEQELKEQQVRSLCEKHSFNFSPRLHITELGGGRGI